jgi:hypothetical protein
MTTHDHQTEAATPPLSEHTAQAVSADPSTASAEPSLPSPRPADGEQQNQSPPSVAPAVSTEHSNVEREASIEELLFADDDLADLRGRWTAVQAGFVDDPKECVQKADVLVSDLVEQLTNGFAQARSRLEEQWARGEEASTEDLRVALMHYREFFERLLEV